MVSKNMKTQGRHSLTGFAFVSLWFTGFVLFVAWPFAASLYWSFCRYDLLSSPVWVGTENYDRLASELREGGKFQRALWNTAYYALLSVPLSVVLGVTLASLLTQRIHGRAILRTCFYIPSLLPAVATSILWMWLLDPKEGWVNHVLEQLGWTKSAWPGWLSSHREAFAVPQWLDFGSKDALVLMSLWGIGNFVIIYSTRLAEVPPALYEAAQLDGAGAGRRFWHISLPMLSPVIFFNVVMGLIQAVQAFTQVYLVSEGTGKPADSTLMLSLHLFLAAFRDLEMGYASAVAWLMFVVLALATYFLFRSARSWVHYGV
jgi:multiple sugar transport system permease protein